MEKLGRQCQIVGGRDRDDLDAGSPTCSAIGFCCIKGKIGMAGWREKLAMQGEPVDPHTHTPTTTTTTKTAEAERFTPLGGERWQTGSHWVAPL